MSSPHNMNSVISRSASQRDYHSKRSSPMLSPVHTHTRTVTMLPLINGKVRKPRLRRTLGEPSKPMKPRINGDVYDFRRFNPLRTIGTGSFARVRLAVDRVTKEVVVLKTMSKSLIVAKKQVTHVHNERNLLGELNSPFILSLKGSFQDNFYLYLVLEYVQGGELYHVLAQNGAIGLTDARIYASEVVCALSYLHSRNVVYRDLKPENILLASSGHIKLADFGFAKALRQTEETYTLCGTPDYLAPEVIEHSGHSFPCDWWTLGVLIYEMRCGHAPFQGNTPYELYQSILTDDVSFPSSLTSDTRSLISSLLIKDPKSRATEVQIRAHPYFAGLSWEDVEQLRIQPSYLPKIKNPLDSHYFDRYPEVDSPVDERKPTNPDLFREF